MIRSIYTDNGFANRYAYLRGLSRTEGFDREKVFLLADLLGEEEDFDGLISMLEDERDGFM